MSILAKRVSKTFRAVILSLAGLSILSACGSELPAQHFRLLTFGTYTDVEVIGVDRARSFLAQERLQQDFDQMHKAWHAWQPGPIGRINSYIAEGKTVASPPSTLPLLKLSQQFAEQSEYLFDPGIGGIIKLWGFHTSDLYPHEPPSDEAINEWLEKKPSIKDVSVEGFHLSSSNTAVKLDFGGIGKGYGVDQAIKRLQEMGIKNAVVNAGGDLRAIGSRHGNPWRIAVRDTDGGGILALISVTKNEAVFTSGNYERNFIWQGKFYHHIIDPRTGHPAKNTASVTVLHPDATTADAAATALFVAGPKDWHRIAKKMGVKFVMLVDNDGVVHMNPAMHERVKLQRAVKDIVLSEPL